jgi:glucokinase
LEFRLAERQSSAMSEYFLLADVGGTNVRFAVLADDGALGAIEHIRVAEHPRFDDALDAYFTSHDRGASIGRALFAVAGVVEDGRCVVTNNSWVVDASELRTRFGFADVRLINDFEAVAWALPQLAPQDLRQIGGGEPKVNALKLALGPGTGLGVAAYVPTQGGLVLGTEGGHASLPGGSAREDAVISALRRKFGHVSIERALSGPGLVNLYLAIATLDGVKVPERTSHDIREAAIAGTCTVSRAAVELFCAWLGEVTGNFALSLGAQGGVYIGGGFVPKMREELLRSQFRARFDGKGRMSDYVKAIPVYLIGHDDPAFIGLRALALKAR